MLIEAAWRLATVPPPPIREWSGDYIVYNPLSGDTHILDIVSGEALRALSEAPLSRSALGARIATLLDLPVDERFMHEVDMVLARLDELGLIEPVAPC